MILLPLELLLDRSYLVIYQLCSAGEVVSTPNSVVGHDSLSSFKWAEALEAQVSYAEAIEAELSSSWKSGLVGSSILFFLIFDGRSQLDL